MPLAFSLTLLAGCSTATVPPLSPTAGSVASNDTSVSVDDICLSWRKALDGYDAAGERRKLADLLRARGEDPGRCERHGDNRKAVPLSPSVGAQAPNGRGETTRRTGSGSRAAKLPGSRRLTMKTALECTSELVKGPPDRYKTVCR